MKRSLVAALVLLPPLHADVLTATQRFFNRDAGFPEAPAEGVQSSPARVDSPFSPADSDLGVQELFAEYGGASPVAVDLAIALFRTDNAPSDVPGADESSWILSSRLATAWRPGFADGWFGDFGVTQHVLRMDRSSAVDYENLQANAGVLKVFPELDDTTFFARYEFQRLTTGSLEDADYSSERIRLGVEKTLFSAPRQEVIGGINAAIDVRAKPSSFERAEFAVELGYRYALTDSVSAMASWRSGGYDYRDEGRFDWAHGLGLELAWQVSDTLRGHVSVFYDMNDSNSPAGENDIKSWTGGVGAGLSLSF